MFDFIDKNVRVPRQVLGDVRSQVAACLTGERGYLALLERHGREGFAACTDALLDQAERLARNAIKAMPDGVYRFADHIDDDGIDPDPIPIAVTVTVAGDHLVADFTGSAPQVKGAINSPIPFTKSAVYACVRHLIGGDPPNNEGYFRPIEVVAPPGTIVNPVLPASVAARGLTGFRIANAVFGALAQVAPDRVFACEVGGDTGVSIGGYDAERRAFVFLEFLFGSWGGRPTRDGIDACSSSVVNFSNNPIEVIEAEYPDPDPALRLSPRLGRRRPVSRRARADPRIPVRGGGGHPPAPHRPPAAPAVRAPGRPLGDAVRELMNPGTPAAQEPPGEVHADPPARRRLPPRVRGPWRLGRSDDARSGARPLGRPRGEDHDRVRAPRVRRRPRPDHARDPARRDGPPPRGPLSRSGRPRGRESRPAAAHGRPSGRATGGLAAARR